MKDKHSYENGVLINKLGIKDEQELMKVEADISFIKLINIDSIKVEYFNEELLQNIHKHIFEDIYPWAGEYRTVPIIKEELVLPAYSIPYSEPKNISKELQEKLNQLNSISWQNYNDKEISNTFARLLALLWRVHPFRDGNTRTMLSFAFLYAKEHNFAFDMKTFTDGLMRKYDGEKLIDVSIRDKFVLACLDEKDYPEVNHLARVFETAIRVEREKEEEKTLK